jgi:hypothetical protein
MTSTALADPPAAPQSPQPGRRGIAGLSPLDQLIVGALILFLVVFVGELSVVVPCGGHWFGLSTCESATTNAAFSTYFDLDPFWSDMPGWYATVMSFQEYVFNPFWALSLVMYATHRQDRPWFRTATIVVSSMIIATTLVVYFAQVDHPDITGRKLALLFVVNGLWALFPALFIVRMHRSANGSLASARGGRHVHSDR